MLARHDEKMQKDGEYITMLPLSLPMCGGCDMNYVAPNGSGEVTSVTSPVENALLAGAGGLANSAKQTTTVIGRVKDLQNLGRGEQSLLSRLPNRGSPQANWRQNAGVLRSEMKRGLPIRDASPGDTGGQFLNAERNLLRDRGWSFDAESTYWSPP